MAESSDRDLVNQTLQGDLEAYSDLVREYQSSVFSVCYRVLGNRRDAEDLTQDTFLRAYNHLDSFDMERPFGPWVRTVAANLCYNHLNQSRLPSMPLLDEHDIPKGGGGKTPEAWLIKNERQERIYQALWQLPPHHRVAIELRHFQDLTYQEMADELEIPLNTVRSHLYRARNKLAELLRKYEGK